MKNQFDEYDSLLRERSAYFESLKTEYQRLKADAEARIAKVAYGKESIYLGHFCPSLIIDKTVKGFKRDKLKTKLRSGQVDYVRYDLDKSDQLVRVNEFNSFGTVFETYVQTIGDSSVSSTFLNGEPVPSNSNVRFKFGTYGIEVFYILGPSHLWEEKYDYKKIGSRIIGCTQTYYVPNLKGSDREIPAGRTGSPAKQYKIELKVDDRLEIVRLEYGELLDGKLKVTYAYEAGT